jgi:hypothetical protein
MDEREEQEELFKIDKNHHYSLLEVKKITRYRKLLRDIETARKRKLNFIKYLQREEGVLKSPMDSLVKDRLEFRRLLQKYHLIDLINDENEGIEWFQRTMLQLAGWVGEKERTREILRRFREEYDRQREERDRFKGTLEAGLPNPHIGRRFRRVRVLKS